MGNNNPPFAEANKILKSTMSYANITGGVRHSTNVDPPSNLDVYTNNFVAENKRNLRTNHPFPPSEGHPAPNSISPHSQNRLLYPNREAQNAPPLVFNQLNIPQKPIERNPYPPLPYNKHNNNKLVESIIQIVTNILNSIFNNPISSLLDKEDVKDKIKKKKKTIGGAT